jgi:hypothetical protein
MPPKAQAGRKPVTMRMDFTGHMPAAPRSLTAASVAAAREVSERRCMGPPNMKFALPNTRVVLPGQRNVQNQHISEVRERRGVDISANSPMRPLSRASSAAGVSAAVPRRDDCFRQALDARTGRPEIEGCFSNTAPPPPERPRLGVRVVEGHGLGARSSHTGEATIAGELGGVGTHWLRVDDLSPRQRVNLVRQLAFEKPRNTAASAVKRQESAHDRPTAVSPMLIAADEAAKVKSRGLMRPASAAAPARANPIRLFALMR